MESHLTKNLKKINNHPSIRYLLLLLSVVLLISAPMTCSIVGEMNHTKLTELASSPGHSQLLVFQRATLKAGSGLGTRLNRTATI